MFCALSKKVEDVESVLDLDGALAQPLVASTGRLGLLSRASSLATRRTKLTSRRSSKIYPIAIVESVLQSSFLNGMACNQSATSGVVS